MTYITIGRQALYAQVWSEPMLQLAKKYELSSAGLAKICRHYDIPCPPRGYWAKLYCGKKLSPTLLPDPSNNCEIGFELRRKDHVVMSDVREELERRLLAEGGKKIKVPVPESLRDSHSLVKLAKHELQGANTDESGLIIPPADAALKIHVSRASLPRALLIMDALLKALERLGDKVTSGPSVEILGVTVRFFIVEQLDTIQEEEELADLKGRYEFGHSRFKTKSILSSRLALQIDNTGAYWDEGYRKAWREGARIRLEDSLVSFISGLGEFAVRKKEHDLTQQKRDEQRREEETQRAEKAHKQAEHKARIAEERKRVAALLKEAEEWNKSQQLERYINARKKHYIAEFGEIRADSEFGQWVLWAEEQGARLNPLVESPASILDDPVDDEDEKEWAGKRPYW